MATWLPRKTNSTPQAGLFRGITLLVSLLIVGTIGFSITEGWDIHDSFYMTIITVSTVGYGEVHPLHTSGRIFASILILTWLGTAFYTTTRLGQWVLEGKLRDVLERRRLMKDIQKMKGHTVVCGFGRIGQIVAEGLEREGVEFCVAETNREIEADLQSTGYRYIIGDATEESILEEAGVLKAKTLLALLPTDADNLYVTIAAKEMNPNITVIARALDDRAEVRLKRSGADKVVSPYKTAGLQVLNVAIKPTVVEFMELVTSKQHLSLGLEEVVVTEASGLNGLSLLDAGIRSRFGVIIVAIKRASGEMVFNPVADEKIQAGDILVTIGKEPDLERLVASCLASS
ncbi:MAG: potassium channel protein [Candidatus Latescibacteria bacterium]|nr:potassium channel protein [Candidatus Latescibacterota bacterium]NIO27226.1 potassium channel protein [Candidatus Latescibacterota bacterium]NIO54750.1 potassium channel protein [Candidatus Latescibacterota bacterium]NIT00833.1 potassium channel protein [Candidatus Latescibacterota bacterium]NIT37756.1 potassium channel protein [Candidatus Latescibacterota bacterium]